MKRILAVTQVEVMRKHGYGYLKEIVVRRADNDLYRFKEGDFPRLRINDIEDMLLLKKINVTKTETTKSGIRKRDSYTPYQDPQGFIYVDNNGRNRLMQSDKLYKFSDGTLTRLRTSLDDITKNIRMEYLPKRRWSTLEKKRADILLVQSRCECRDWLDKEPPRSILTWDDLVSKFINQYFPPSKTTYYRNEIITFYQKPNEAFNEAWERFKGLLRQCPHHGFSELHQLDTFYNSLNSNDQDALDSAAGGNFLDKMPQEGLAIIESKSKVRYSRSRANDSRMNKMLNEMKALVVTTPAPVKAVEEGGSQQNPEQQKAQEEAKSEADERRQMMLSQILSSQARERRK
ncbi:reverse transcriptase domain-containing protein [Tanacetum coccineum]